MIDTKGLKGEIEMRRRIRMGTLLLLMLAVLTTGVLAVDGGMMPPDGMMPPPPPAGGPGGPGGAPTEAAVVITDGEEDTEAEYEPGAYSDMLFPEEDTLVLENLVLNSGDYGFNGISVTGSESAVRLRKAMIRLTVDSPASGEDSGGAAVSADNGATVFISDSDLVVDGSARYVTAAYNDATLVVNDSLVQSTGSNANTAEIAEPFSNEALLISGTARANFSIGATRTYYFNSTCIAEGWAALSTDSAMGNGLDLYAYNTDGIAENGGYGAYADTNCRVWLYGSRLQSAEIGAIISKSGRITALPARMADETLLAYNEGETVSADTSLVGGRNALMIHAPDMMGQGLYAADCGTFTAENAYIGTTEDLRSTKDYYDYGEAVGAYIDYVSGSDILIRSTSANIDLKHVEMESYNNTLIHTVLNADSMGNFLASGDGDLVNPVAVTMTDMDVTGDIRHEDYQRRMTLELDHATLSGNIVSGTMEDWNDTWKDYGEVNWVVDETFDAVYGVSLTMKDGAVWNVTGASSLTELTLEEGAVLNGTVTLDGEELIPEPDVTYTGSITVTGDYVPLEEDEETQEPEPEENEPEPAAEASPEPELQAELPEEAPAPEEPETEDPQPDDRGRKTGTAVAIGAALLAAIGGGGTALRKRKQK